MNPDQFNNKIFGVLSSYRAKPFEKIQNHLMRHVDEPLQDQLQATLPNQLDFLVNEHIVNRNEHGYKLNPFHPVHSRNVPDIEHFRSPPSSGAGPARISTGTAQGTSDQLCYMPGIGRMSRKSYETLMERRRSEQGETSKGHDTSKNTLKRKGRSRSRSTPKKTGRARSRSQSGTRRGRGMTRGPGR